MIPEGAENHIADSKADAENEDYKYQAKALSAIKKGLEISVFELYEQNSKLQSTIEEKDKRIEQLKERADEYFEIIKQLCFLKDMKDNMGKTEQYLKQQPVAWKAAFSAIEEQQ